MIIFLIFLLSLMLLDCPAHTQDSQKAEASSGAIRALSTVTNLSGISAILRRVPNDGNILVVGVIEGGPAEKAGLRIDDVIVSVDGKPTSGEELEHVVGRLRGAPGTKVTLEIERSGRSHTIEITRDLVRLKTVVAPLVIKVQGDRYWIGENEMSLAEITQLLQDRASRDQSWPIKIQVDKEMPYSALESILEKCRDTRLINVEVFSPDDTTDKATQ
jgi:membrane-associated protease RseP (regulator of RpoE activity)